jgi:hypothetical protein
MLIRERLTEEFRRKREDFAGHLREQDSQAEFYLAVLRQLETSSAAELSARLGAEECGAYPAESLAESGSFVFPFEIAWANHEEARDWAATILEKRTTFAADGSQLYVEKETSLPVGAVQVGWLENPHDASKPYEKNVRFELLAPHDLLVNQDESFDPATRVGERRFHAEAERLGQFLSKHRGWQERNERMPLALFDGTLLVSFALPKTILQKSFVQAMVNLVRHSRDVRVPIVGYIDRSFSHDLISMLECFSGCKPPGPNTLYDAALLNHRPANGVRVHENWGDRTAFCYSRRSGLADFKETSTGDPLVGFVFLRTTSGSTPARLDMPSWLLDDGLVNEVVDVVRAECVIGLGYPYVLEAADQAAVIGGADRDVFLRALQEFANREKLDFSVSRKDASKARRR